MIWSPVKEEVFSFDTSMVVSAGAGSGKTATLVELYLRLLARETSFPHPVGTDEIVAITFTDKAAVEMKERVRRGMMARHHQGDCSADWRSLVWSLPHAPISTFHSFCSRVLREHPVEGGVDPSFTLLDEFSSRSELQAALDELIQQELKEGSESIRLLLRQFPLSGAGRGKGLAEHLVELVRNRSGSCTTEATMISATVQWDEHARQQFEAGYVELMELADEVERILTGKTLAFHQKLARLPGLIPTSPLQADDERAAVLLDLMEECVAGNWGKEKAVKDRLLDCLATLQDTCWQLRSSPIATTLLAYAFRLTRMYELRKERIGALDFEDLQTKTRDLLFSSSHLRNNFRSRFPVIMVDEFQDTNPLQKELVALLCGSDQRLFIVGDPKQSIYLFRGADVTVFGEAQADVAAAGGKNLFFQESFRSREGITSFVNRLFGEIVMTGGNAAFDIRYDEGDHLLPHRRDSDGEPCVELVTIAGEGNSAALRCTEATAVARKIRNIVSGNLPVRVFDKNGEPGRCPRYGDIALLFPRFTNLKQFERELRRHGIPYYVVKGKGFYRCQEILDMVNFLACLESGRDLIPLVGVLRSPLCGVSDETLYRLANFPGGIGGWQRSLTMPDMTASIPVEDKLRLDSLSRLMDRLRPLRDRLTLPELLEEIITGTDIASILVTTFQGEQKISNLRKLIELSRGFVERKDGTLHRFIASLKELIETEPTEAEAVISTEKENVVRLMTVHQSKGLEFPIVFIPEIGGGSPANGSAIAYDDRLGLGLRLAVPGRESRPSLAYRQIANLRAAREDAELKRLFYVAVTRARDYLVLTGEGKGPWRKWVEAFAAGDTAGVLKVTAAETAAEDLSDVPASDVPPRTVSPEEMSIAVQRSLHHRPPLPSSMVFSPTALEDYLHCPRKYYYKRVAGLDEGLFNELLHPRRGHAGSTGMSPLEKGNLAHGILELLDFTDNTEGILSQCRSLSRQLAPGEPEEGIEEVIARVADFARSTTGRELAENKLLREEQFTLQLNGDATYYIQGAMDLVAVSPSAVTVYDYKYVAREAAELDGYRFQVGVYMLALSRAYPDRQVRGYLVFLKGGPNEEIKSDPEEYAALLCKTMNEIRHRSIERDFGLRVSCDGGHCPFRTLCTHDC